MTKLIINKSVLFYKRTESGKSWRANPYKIYRDELTEEQYMRAINDKYKCFGERRAYGYTPLGYLPIQITSYFENIEKAVIKFDIRYVEVDDEGNRIYG